MAEGEGLEHQIPQRTVQIIEGQKMSLGSELKGPLRAGVPARRKRSLWKALKYIKRCATMDDLHSFFLHLYHRQRKVTAPTATGKF